MQYLPPNLLFVPFTIVLLNYGGDAVRDSDADQTKIWTIGLAEYVFMAKAMFIVSTKHGACVISYTQNLCFDRVTSGPLFRLPGRLLHAFAYFKPYKATLDM